MGDVECFIGEESGQQRQYQTQWADSVKHTTYSLTCHRPTTQTNFLTALIGYVWKFDSSARKRPANLIAAVARSVCSAVARRRVLQKRIRISRSRAG